MHDSVAARLAKLANAHVAAPTPPLTTTLTITYKASLLRQYMMLCWPMPCPYDILVFALPKRMIPALPATNATHQAHGHTRLVCR